MKALTLVLQLGDGLATPMQASPVRVAGVERATLVAAGGPQSCARLEDDTVLCWGFSAGIQAVHLPRAVP